MLTNCQRWDFPQPQIPAFIPLPHPLPFCSPLLTCPAQVNCLKLLRAIEAGKPVEELTPEGYRPSDKALALMTRGESKHPFVAGIEDTL